jgi:hypothetical protein
MGYQGGPGWFVYRENIASDGHNIYSSGSRKRKVWKKGIYQVSDLRSTFGAVYEPDK